MPITIGPAFKPASELIPKAGAQGLQINLDFTGGVTSITGDLLNEQTRGLIDFVQSIFVDNSQSAQSFTIQFSFSKQRIVVPAGASGTFPVYEQGKIKFTATSTGNAIIPVILLNVQANYSQYGPIDVTVTNVTATFTPTVGVISDASGSIAAGGTSQELFAANANAIRRIVQNPASNFESIFINFGGNAASAGGDSIELTPGQMFDTQTGPIDQTQWTVVAASITTPYVAKEME